MKKIFFAAILIFLAVFSFKSKPPRVSEKKKEEVNVQVEKKTIKVDPVKSVDLTSKEVIAEEHTTTPGQKTAAQDYNLELSRWLTEADARIQGAPIENIESRLLDDGTLLYEGLTQQGQKFISQTDSQGRPLAEEIQFADGRKFSKSYYAAGQIKALYFEKSKQFAFSVSFNENGTQVDIIRSQNGIKTRSDNF